MSAFNRGLLSLLAIGWCVALAGCLILVWDQSRSVALDWPNLSFGFAIFADSRAEQVLATIILGALALPALLLIVFEVVPHGRSASEIKAAARQHETSDRADSLQKQLDDERKRRESAEKQLTDQRDRRESAEKDALERRQDAAGSSSRRWHFLPGSHH